MSLIYDELWSGMIKASFKVYEKVIQWYFYEVPSMMNERMMIECGWKDNSHLIMDSKCDKDNSHLDESPKVFMSYSYEWWLSMTQSYNWLMNDYDILFHGIWLSTKKAWGGIQSDGC